MWSWRRMEKINLPENIINEVLEHIRKKRTLINGILRRKANYIGHIVTIDCLIHDAIGGQMTEMK